MSGNKGYIWRGVWYFGEKKFNNTEPVSMIEKKDNNVYVFEYTKDYFKKYIREFGKPDKLLFSKKRILW
jgi:hypothetical protein